MFSVEHCTTPSLLTIMMLRIQGRLVGRLARRISQLLPIPPGGADIGGRLQHRFDRRDHLALGIGAVLGDVGVFFRRQRTLLGAGAFEGTDALHHQGRYQNQRNSARARIPRSSSKFEPIAVESNARHSVSLTASQGRAKVSKSLSRTW